MDRFQEAVEYRYDQGWTTSDNRAFTFWVRPKYDSPIGTNVLITSLEDSNGYLRINTGGLPEKANKLSIGDWIVISGTNSYNSIFEILSINEGTNSLIVDTPYVDNVLSGTPKFNREKSANFLCYENELLPPTKLVSFTYTPNWFIIKLNNTYHKFKLSLEGASLVKDEWYAFVINLNNVANQLSLFVYNTLAQTGAINPNISNELNPIYSKVTTVSPIAIENGKAWRLLGSSTDLTNIRIWKSPIEEELQELILSQYVVKDTHLTLLLDNATPQLLLDRQTNPR
jgi:hypothetical protein